MGGDRASAAPCCCSACQQPQGAASSRHSNAHRSPSPSTVVPFAALAPIGHPPPLSCACKQPLPTLTRSGCATQVPSWPAVTSRSLSARTCGDGGPSMGRGGGQRFRIIGCGGWSWLERKKARALAWRVSDEAGPSTRERALLCAVRTRSRPIHGLPGGGLDVGLHAGMWR